MSLVILSVEPSGGRWAVKHNEGILGYVGTEAEAWSLIESLAETTKEARRTGAEPTKRYRQLSRSAQSKPRTILIVEDEAIISLELISWFEELGMTPLAASNADEAIALLEKHPEIELVLTDVKMPGGSIDGLGLAHHVRNRWPPVKIIILSGVLQIDDVQLPLSSIFLTKPCAPETLMDAMAHLIHRHG
jgi:CheY-like chemotaxis protein